MNRTFKVGDRVWWTDPDDDLYSGPGTVVCVHGEDEDTMVCIDKDDGGSVEALQHELKFVCEVRR